MTKVGFTTTIPLEILIAAKKTPVDLNNSFITNATQNDLLKHAEIEGFPRNMCTWVKGIYSVVIQSDIREVIAVTQGDCSNTQALMETLTFKGISTIPFFYPYDRDEELLSHSLNKLMHHYGVANEECIEVKSELDRIRRKVHLIDERTWKENTVSGFENHYYILFIPVMIGLIYLLFQMGLIFGGADAKALMAIAILVPIQPAIVDFPLWDTMMPFSFVIFFNSLILFLAIPLGLLIFNICKKNVKFPHSFLGYKMEIKKARKKFVWPLEVIVDDKIKFVYMPKDFDANEEYDELEKHGVTNIWITPKVPFMIPLLIGYIFSF